MHELYLAESLIEQIERCLSKEGAAKVHKVTVQMGKLSGVEREPFEFAFKLASEGRITEKTKLVIEEVPLEISCGDCGEKTCPEIPFMKCGRCDSVNVKIISGKDFLIKSMEIE